jgi:inhibitor of KinA sporulation pathway (predicted exonuclease)
MINISTPKNNSEIVKKFGTLQDKKYLCAMDLELTCWDSGDPDAAPAEDREITEIGVVVYDLQYNEVSRISHVVRPTLYPKISKYNTELTGITQEEVDAANPLPQTLRQLFEEGLPPVHEFVWVTWSRDPDWLMDEIRRKRITLEFDPRYVDVKLCDAAITGKRRTLKKALRAHNIPQEYPAHRALPDAISTGRLAARLRLSALDCSISNKRSYKQALESAKGSMVDKFCARTRCSDTLAVKILKAVKWDFQSARNVYEIFKSDLK